jgi:hypothetical protein
MKNIKFPHFDFNEWLYLYCFLTDNIEKQSEEFDKLLNNDESYSEEFWDMHERFFNQIHFESDDSDLWNIPSLFLEKMTKFNYFMVCLDNKPSKEHIYEYMTAYRRIKLTEDMKRNIDTVLKLLEIAE